jgi:Flp pilus assembly pilin Flp
VDLLAVVNPLRTGTNVGDLVMSGFASAIRRFVREEDGATLVEYALAIALISLVAGAGAVVLGQGISTFFGSTSSGVNSITVPAPS